MAHTNSLFRAMRGTVSHLSPKAGETRVVGRQTGGMKADDDDDSLSLRESARTCRARARHMSAIFPKYNIMYSFVGGTSRAPFVPAGRPAGRGPTRRLAREDRPVLYFRRYSFVAHTDTPPHFIPRLLSRVPNKAIFFYRGCGALSLRGRPP